MKCNLKAYSIWEYGQRKDKNGSPHQEDWLYPLPDNLTDRDSLFVLCDGMGGHDAGEIASSTVCDSISGFILSSASKGHDSAFSENVFEKAMDYAYSELNKKDTGAAKKMGTTMTFLKFYEEGCLIAHIGDSRVYHIRPGKDAQSTKILFKTRDHSLVNDLIKLGEITEEEAKYSTQKNVITRAMQPNMEYPSKPDIHICHDVQPGDYFYLCTDGMLENMEDNQLCYYFSKELPDDADKIEKLRTATRENKDNHSAFVIHVINVEKNGNPEELNKTIKPVPEKSSESCDYKRGKTCIVRKVLVSLIIVLLAVLTGIFVYKKYFSNSWSTDDAVKIEVVNAHKVKR